MKLERLEFSNHEIGWTLAPLDFHPDVTLLVGVSGVGKTRIISALSLLKDIAMGRAAHRPWWGLEWNLQFSIADGIKYEWRGSFERMFELDDHSSFGSESIDSGNGYAATSVLGVPPPPQLACEALRVGESLLIDRTGDDFKFRGNTLPKLSRIESALEILAHEAEVSEAIAGFERLLSVTGFEDPELRTRVNRFPELMQKHSNLDAIRSAELPALVKLELARKNAPEAFHRVEKRYIEIFPQVQEVGFELLMGDEPSNFLSVRIRERGIKGWIPQQRISHGMFRTLTHLAQMAMCAPGTVILIDDFEASLGVNCIDFVTQDVVACSNDVQFVITSHHPYIINNIDVRHWKIVTRDGSVVHTHDATEFGLEQSSHQAFVKLLNLDQFREGIAAR